MKNPEKLIQDNPGSVFFAQIAEQCVREGDIERALDVLHKGIEANPVYAPGYSILGSLYCDMKQYDDALKYWKLGLEIDPLMPHDIFRLGVYYLENDMVSDAVPYLEIAAVYEPHNEQIQAYREEAESREMTSGDLGLAAETVMALEEITSHGMDAAMMIPETAEKSDDQDVSSLTDDLPEPVENEAPVEPEIPNESAVTVEADKLPELIEPEVVAGPVEPEIPVELFELELPAQLGEPDVSDDSDEPQEPDTAEEKQDSSVVDEPEKDRYEDEQKVAPGERSLDEHNRLEAVEEDVTVEEDILAKMDFMIEPPAEEETVDFQALLDDFEFGMTDDDTQDNALEIAGIDLNEETVEERPEAPDYDLDMYDVMEIGDSSGINDESDDAGEIKDERVDAAIAEDGAPADDHDAVDDTLIVIDNSAKDGYDDDERGYETMLDDITNSVNGGRLNISHEDGLDVEKPIGTVEETLLSGTVPDRPEAADVIDSAEKVPGVDGVSKGENFEPDYFEPELIQDTPVEADDVLSDYHVDIESYDIGMNETIPPAGYDPTISYEEPEEYVIDLGEVADDDSEAPVGDQGVEKHGSSDRTPPFKETFLEDFDYDAFSRDIESLLEPFRKAEGVESSDVAGIIETGEIDDTIVHITESIDEEVDVIEGDDGKDSFYGTLSPEEISMLSKAGEEGSEAETAIDREEGIDYTDIIAESQDGLSVEDSMAQEFERHIQATMASVPEPEEVEPEIPVDAATTVSDLDTVPDAAFEQPSEVMPVDTENIEVKVEPAIEPVPAGSSVSPPVSQPLAMESLDDLLSGYVHLIEEENRLNVPLQPVAETDIAELSPDEKALVGKVPVQSPAVDLTKDMGGEPLTATMAEIYVKQGLVSRAVAMYRKLSEKYPENKGFAIRLTELRYIEETRQDEGA